MKLQELALLAVCTTGLLGAPRARAQSITYLSNTNQPVAGSDTIFPSIGVQFETGTNPGGYTFKDVQLLMANAVDSPTGSLLVDLYYPSPIIGGPNSFTANLSGNTNPVTAGLYVYSATSNIILTPSTDYYIQAQTGGSDPRYYEWDYTSTTNSTHLDGWNFTGTNQFNVHEPFFPYPMLAIDAVPIEPVSPVLAITRSGTNALVSWPVAAGSFVLQSTPGLSAPNWTTASNSPATVSSNYVVTNGLTGSAQFFRLKSQ